MEVWRQCAMIWMRIRMHWNRSLLRLIITTTGRRTNLSEEVIVTVHGKFYEQDTFIQRRITAHRGDNLLTVLKKNGYYRRDCSGNGTCGKCVVRYGKDAPLPTANERMLLSAQEMREGIRLACRHALVRDVEIALCGAPEKMPDVIVDTGNRGKNADIITGAGHHTEDTVGNGSVFFAADVGTTTVVIQAVKKGEVIGTYTALNPQRCFGADVASRISAAMQGHGQELTEEIRTCLSEGVRSLICRCGEEPAFMVVVGNTAMNYLLRGLDPDVLGSYPFSPIDTQVECMKIRGINCYILPGISAFVGGDITAGILATGLVVGCPDTMPQTDMGECAGADATKKSLLVDLGTNGEMVLLSSGRLLCTATAAGPAFEGSAAGGIMGADLIGAAAKLLDRGMLDETGLLAEPYFTEGIDVEGFHIRQTDIRELQKAKAAVSAGISCLCKRAKIAEEEITTVYLAGGFGYYLDPESAIRIGLFPECFRGKIKAVGNTALAGAKLLGVKMLQESAIMGRLAESKMERSICSDISDRIREQSDSINLAEETDFAKIYIERVSFPG